MDKIIILIAIGIIAVISVINYIKRIKSGSCCSGEGILNAEKVKVKDKNKSHYPYKKVLNIGGMTCSHCAKNIENHLNKINNVYSKVDFDREEAIILMKEELDYKLLEDAIKDLGYRYYIKD